MILRQKRIRAEGLIIACLIGFSLVCISEQSGNSNPYQTITERNVFGLKPAIQLPPATSDQPQTIKNLFLTGISVKKGEKVAHFATPDPSKPGTQKYFSLREKDSDSGIEVLEINERAGTVKIKNYGNIVDLSFEKNGLKPQQSATLLPQQQGQNPQQMAMAGAPGAQFQNPMQMQPGQTNQFGAQNWQRFQRNQGAQDPNQQGQDRANVVREFLRNQNNNLTPEDIMAIRNLQRALYGPETMNMRGGFPVVPGQ